MIMTGVATALDVQDYVNAFYPCRWDQWITLPIRTGMEFRPTRPDDDVLHSLHFDFRCPTIIILGKYNATRRRVPKKNLKGLAARDNSTCQITGEKIGPSDWSIEHCLPKSRGGSDDWTNLALVTKSINHSRGNKTLEESGHKLIRQPKAPLPLAPISFLFSSHPDHLLFLHR